MNQPLGGVGMRVGFDDPKQVSLVETKAITALQHFHGGKLLNFRNQVSDKFGSRNARVS